MKTILLIHGVNLNLLGKREWEHYGTLTLGQLEKLTSDFAKGRGFKILAFQSNHEGALVDFLQKESPNAEGIIINPGAFTHYSYALHDAILDTRLPAIEVHLSKINQRESWSKKSVIAEACVAVISGRKEKGYLNALEKLDKIINKT